MQHSGLSSSEVLERQRQGLVNRLPGQHWRLYGSIIFRNLATWFNALVLPAAIALFQLGEYRGAIAVSGMMLVNTMLGLVQEIAAKARLDRLTLVSASKVRVIRDSQIQNILMENVVKDDLLPLSVGEHIVADGYVLESQYLEVDEALLTGESDPVPRSLNERLMAGSYCVAGEGVYQVDRVGAEVMTQHIAHEARLHRYHAGPIQQAIDFIVRMLTLVAIALCAVYLIRFWIAPFSQTELVQMVAATITSMVPQGLVLTATLAFTLGAIRLTLRGAVVQRLDSVEAMAAADVLCLDKTGTLTTNRLQLELLTHLDKDNSESDTRDRLRLFISAAVDRTNKVLVALREALGEGAVEKLDELPFKAQNRFSAVKVRDGHIERTLLLGACEVLLKFINPENRPAAETAWQHQLGTGLRLLLFGELPANVPLGSITTYAHLRPLALIGLKDEVRQEALSALAELKNQGISFKVISGDHPRTVHAALKHLNESLGETHVLSGEELKNAQDEDNCIERGSVFGQVSPQQKLAIIENLQRRGRFVAMVGDGVNDVLAVKKSDLGVAMGAGSSACKTVAGLVLLTNNFNLLPMAMMEARIAVHNLRRAGKLFLAKNVFTMLLIACATGLLGLAFPYLPQQVTLLNFLTIGLPAVLFTLGRASGGSTNRHRFLREILYFAVTTGGIIGTAGTILLMISHSRGDSFILQRTILLSLLVLLGLQNVFRVIREDFRWDSINDRLLLGAILIAIPIFLIAVYWPFAADFFQLVRLSSMDWMLVLAVALPAALMLECHDHWQRMRSMKLNTKRVLLD